MKSISTCQSKMTRPELPIRAGIPTLIAIFVGCSGQLATNSVASADQAHQDAITNHVMQPKLRLGHYSSPDGAVGFVLDRTGPKPKIRIDRTTDIVELEPETE